MPILDLARNIFDLSDEEILEGEQQVRSVKPQATDDEVLNDMVSFAKQSDPRVLKQGKQPQQPQQQSLYDVAEDRARKRSQRAIPGDILSGFGEILMGNAGGADSALKEREASTKKEEFSRVDSSRQLSTEKEEKDPSSTASKQFQDFVNTFLGIQTEAPASLLKETFPHIAKLYEKQITIEQQKALQDKQFKQNQEKETKLTEENRKQKVLTAVNNFNKDPIVRKSQENLMSIGKLLATIATGNPISDSSLVTFFSKASGEVGNLAEQEQLRFSGSQAFLSRLNQLAKKLTTGLQTEENIRYGKELANEWKKFAQGFARGLANNRARQIADLVEEDENVLTDRYLKTFNFDQKEDTSESVKKDVKKLSDDELDAEIKRLKEKQGVK